MACRIGIIGDGPTDSKVIGRLAECISFNGDMNGIIHPYDALAWLKC